MRQTFASLLLQAGEPITYVQPLLKRAVGVQPISRMGGGQAKDPDADTGPSGDRSRPHPLNLQPPRSDKTF